MYKRVKLVGWFVQWIDDLMIGLGRKDEYSSLHAFLLVAFVPGVGGGTSTKDPLEMCHQHGYPAWVAKSASWYMNGSLKMQHLVCEWVDIFIIFLNLSQNWIKCIPGFLTKLYLNKIMGYLKS